MKKGKIILVSILSIGILTGGLMSVSALSNSETKSELLSKLTNKPVEQINSERYEKNKSYGTIASENGVLDEFKKANLKNKKVKIQEQVNKGTLTQEKANVIIANIEKNMANCDGTGSAKNKQSLKIKQQLHDGTGSGNKNGKGMGKKGYRNQKM